MSFFRKKLTLNFLTKQRRRPIRPLPMKSISLPYDGFSTTQGTKKTSRYYLEENISYGFRRNSYALKNIGIVASIGTFLWVLISQQILAVDSKGGALLNFATASQAAVGSLAVSAVMMFVWLWFFNERSVRNAAFTYAESLLRACDKL